MTRRSVMKADITVDYDVEPDEFDQLIVLYPTGQYKSSPDSDFVKWFKLEISNKITLTWFRTWRN